MKTKKIFLFSLALSVAGAAFGQDKQNAPQDQANQPKASSPLKMHAASQARTATGMKDGKQQDAVARRERAEKIAGSVQKKTNETASAAASNVK